MPFLDADVASLMADWLARIKMAGPHAHAWLERHGTDAAPFLLPAALGKPIVSGPSLENFRDIADRLVEAGAMKVVDNPIDLGMAVGSLVKERAMAAKAGLKGKDVVESGRGALKATADLVCDLLPKSKDARSAEFFAR